MEMQGSRDLGVTQQQAWDSLNDPEVLKACIPGCEKVEPNGENAYTVGMALRIGPVAARFTGAITLTNIQAPNSYELNFEGQGGPAGFGKGGSKVTLTPIEGGTRLDYAVSAQVGGKVAQLGQRLIDGAARSLAEDFFKRFDAEMGRRYGEPAPLEAADALSEAAGTTVADPLAAFWAPLGWGLASFVVMSLIVWLA
ncbi:MAG: hypothetical protein RL357_1469 [Pseudomonadota bacterium]|jgi:carbon monoxide dehydrogenase subunit G